MHSFFLFSQNNVLNITTEKTEEEVYPNMSIKSLMTPTAWGSIGKYAFGTIGGTFPQPYNDFSDLTGGAGLALGDFEKYVSVASIFNFTKVTSFKSYSASFIVSRRLAKGSAISGGALYLFTQKTTLDPGPSYYIVFSHAAQNLSSEEYYTSKLCYSIGVGNGRFYKKSPKDIATGKGEHGTAVFGNLSYEMFTNINLNAEWTGLNIALSTAWRPNYKWPAFAAGIADITKSSGSARFIFSVGYAVMLTKHN